MEVGITDSQTSYIAANAAPLFAPFTPQLPYSMQAAHAKHNSHMNNVLDGAGVHFDASAITAFYPLFRSSGYFFSLHSKDIKKEPPWLVMQAYEKLFGKLPEPEAEVKEAAKQEVAPVIPKTTKGFLEPGQTISTEDQLIIEETSNQPEKEIKEEIKESNPTAAKEEKPALGSNLSDKKRQLGKFTLQATETLVYGGIAAWSFHKENQQLVKDCSAAIAAEQGIPEKKIQTGLSNLFSGPIRDSRNPLVVSAVDRQVWQNILRIPATAAMFFHIETGVTLNMFVTGFERSVFSRPLAIDLLRKAITDVQLNGLGQETKPILVDNLIKTLQQANIDHRKDPYPKPTIDALRPVLNMFADDIIDNQISFEKALYVMGGGVLVPENAKISLNNYENIRHKEMADIISSKSVALNAAPQTKIHSIIEHKNLQNRPAKAASAEDLLHHRQILATIPAHYGANSSMSYDSGFSL